MQPDRYPSAGLLPCFPEYLHTHPSCHPGKVAGCNLQLHTDNIGIDICGEGGNGQTIFFTVVHNRKGNLAVGCHFCSLLVQIYFIRVNLRRHVVVPVIRPDGRMVCCTLNGGAGTNGSYIVAVAIAKDPLPFVIIGLLPGLASIPIMASIPPSSL